MEKLKREGQEKTCCVSILELGGLFISCEALNHSNSCISDFAGNGRFNAHDPRILRSVTVDNKWLKFKKEKEIKK